MKGKCEWCGINTDRIERHHLIPRRFGGTEIIEVCPYCHTELERRFQNFIDHHTIEDEFFDNLREQILRGKVVGKKVRETTEVPTTYEES